ncbi:hypothetical protein M885DRAFT_589457 [Pelagophyceae sp. CCMP2097]|nr:hypothetical protein M885DRAFT_589457 [Pelagophyceae sp. CCMP2097]
MLLRRAALRVPLCRAPRLAVARLSAEPQGGPTAPTPIQPTPIQPTPIQPLKNEPSTFRLAHGMPDFVEKWCPDVFRKVGYGLAAVSLVAWPLAGYHEVSIVAPVFVSGITMAYWQIGLNDLRSKTQTLRRNFPVLIHARYFLESIRPEIQQYLIEDDQQAVPFSRQARSVVYQRSKGEPDTRALGTRRDVYKEGFEWVNHTMFPVAWDAVEDRVTIGGPDCLQPYSASLLNISAMSYGALSGPAVEALNRGAMQGGFYHNTGEGGISRFHLTGADVVWNIGTGYFACGENVGTQGERRFHADQFKKNAALPQVKMIELKLSQGAKPAHGGILPASKITAQIAEARGLGAPPWLDCVSPPRHSAFGNPVELLEFLKSLRDMSAGKPVGWKMCVGQPHEACALVHAMLRKGARVRRPAGARFTGAGKAACPLHDRTGIVPDFITVDGGEGGTGAAPPEFQDSVGMPVQEGLMLINSLLVGAGLRDRVKLVVAGKVYNGFSLVRLLALGADVTNCARAMMFSLGCIQALKCNSNKCPTGITTQDPTLSSALDVESKSMRVANFHAATVHSAKEIIGAIGVTRGADIKPEHIMRRDSGSHVRTYADLHSQSYFQRLEPNQLVDGSVLPPIMQKWWTDGAKLVPQ